MATVAPFPAISNTVAPPISSFFTETKRNLPPPTNAAWQNFVLNSGDQPEYLHPYLVKSSQGAISISYPKRVASVTSIFQVFVADLIISCVTGGTHTVIGYDDLTLTLSLPGPMIVPLARGSPYVTFRVQGGTLTLKTIHAVLSVSSNAAKTKHRVTLNSNQIWLIYASQALNLDHNLGISGSFGGILRIALLTDDLAMDPRNMQAKESVLDQYSNVFPVSGSAIISAPYSLIYNWSTNNYRSTLNFAFQNNGLLMLSHSVQRQILVRPSFRPSVTFRSIDGDLIGVVGTSWMLEDTQHVPILWHSFQGFKSSDGVAKVKAALQQDVANLREIDATATYFYGKAIARVARLALIAEQVNSTELIPTLTSFIKRSLTPWLDGTHQGNGLVYDARYGGIISKNGANDQGADFGLGIYNDHHYHFGYFIYAIATAAKFDRAWATKYVTQISAICRDVINYRADVFPRVRNFDFWILHSWASGLREFADGRNQESSSEAVNAYYSLALLGSALADKSLQITAETLLALEIRSAKALWQVTSGNNIYDKTFVDANRVGGVLWANKRDTSLWWAPQEWRECRTGIQIIPLSPITQSLFSDKVYVKELVDWTMPALERNGVLDGWKGFVYALQAIYDPAGALTLAQQLKQHDDGNSLSNLLWWIYTRP